MKKFLICSVLFMLAVSSGWADTPKTKSPPTKIDCDLKPRERTESRLAGTGYPHIHLKESTSLNWSGYAAATSLAHPTNGSVSSVSGSWIVPTITSTIEDAYSSIWVGIDGYSSGTVEQIGTEHDWSSGEENHYAWFEMYPRGSYEIVGFPVNPGDHITAKVKYLGNNVFKLMITNSTVGVYTIIPHSYTTMKGTKRSSAEWVVEAPSSNSGVLPLANFGTVTLTNCLATIKGFQGSISNAHWHSDPLNMASGSTIKAVPSSLSSKGQNFSVTWYHE